MQCDMNRLYLQEGLEPDQTEQYSEEFFFDEKGCMILSIAKLKAFMRFDARIARFWSEIGYDDRFS